MCKHSTLTNEHWKVKRVDKIKVGRVGTRGGASWQKGGASRSWASWQWGELSGIRLKRYTFFSYNKELNSKVNTNVVSSVVVIYLWQCLFLQQFSTNYCKKSRESYSYNTWYYRIHSTRKRILFKIAIIYTIVALGSVTICNFFHIYHFMITAL